MQDASSRRERVLARWEESTAWVFVVASIVFLVLYSLRVIGAEAVSDPWSTAVGVALVAIWGLFVVDYLARLAIAPRRAAFVRRNWVDLLSVLVPVFRPFRLVKELNRIPGLRGHTGLKLRRRVLLVG